MTAPVTEFFDDDVVDDSDERRGFFSINALWKNKISVLIGDFLLSLGSRHFAGEQHVVVEAGDIDMRIFRIGITDAATGAQFDFLIFDIGAGAAAVRRHQRACADTGCDQRYATLQLQ